MIRAHIATLVYSVVAAAALEADQLVGFDDAPAGADEPVQGVVKTDTAAGDAGALIALGIVELEAATPIAKGAPVYSDADGKATAAGANNPFGRAIRAASNAGDIVAVHIR